jgi:hypothetical protein
MKFRDLIFKTEEQLQREAERKEFKRIQREQLKSGEIKNDYTSIISLGVLSFIFAVVCIVELLK